MAEKLELAGQRYGRLVVLSEATRRASGHACWHCICDCGNRLVVFQVNLRRGHTQSCGCLHREIVHEHETTHGHTVGAPSGEYRSWCQMLARCENPKSTSYPLYGGRGISVCARWHRFALFLADMGPRPSPRHSLDRIDNEAGYEPGNVRWASLKEQANNKRSNRRIEHSGVTKTMTQWAESAGVPMGTFHARLKQGWSMDRALSEPVARNGGPHLLTHNGETHSLVEWERLLGFPEGRIGVRLRLGWTAERALTQPVICRKKK